MAPSSNASNPTGTGNPGPGNSGLAAADKTTGNTPSAASGKPTKPAPKGSSHHGFGTNMPMMSSAFDTAMWLSAA